ncbi:MAG: glutamate--tRNA ligase, partial [Candidatus Colwellbacteria bacterium]|nr:glutamate--tRNA ligase [Candidatus Colwellbacteria bacterium]
EIKEALAISFEPLSYEADSLHFKDKKDSTKKNLEKILALIELSDTEDFANADLIEKLLANTVDSEAKGEWLWPLRVALSGRKASPGPYEIMSAIGKEESIVRVRKAIEKLS